MRHATVQWCVFKAQIEQCLILFEHVRNFGVSVISRYIFNQKLYKINEIVYRAQSSQWNFINNFKIVFSVAKESLNKISHNKGI